MKKIAFDYKTVNSMSRDAAARYMLDLFPKEHIAPKDNQIVLPDTSLCAIVRDEIVNPAHGIVDFVHSTVPYVEEAVIVDTGSIDGTREVLEELQSVYPHLRVIDREFGSFTDARNTSLRETSARKRLILDADERIKQEDFLYLKANSKFEKVTMFDALVFPILDVAKSGKVKPNMNAHYSRLVGKHAHFISLSRRGIGEVALIDGEHYKIDLPIYHFTPSSWNKRKKDNGFYSQLDWGKDLQPVSILDRHKWMEPNVHRDAYR